MKVTRLAIVAVAVSTHLPASSQGVVEFRDDFSGYANGSDGAPRWLTHSILWEIRDGAYTFDGRSPGFAVVGEAPNYRQVVIEATVVLHESYGDSWKVAGVAVYSDNANFWHLALVESPAASGRRHYVELAEMLKGEWLSQTRLRETVREGLAENAWQYDVPYRMRIELRQDEILGTISDIRGNMLHRLGYAFTAPAVTAGRAALKTSMFRGAFDDVEVSMSDPVPLSEKAPLPSFGVTAAEETIGRPTGFYHVKEINGVWWVVDPLGRRFYAIGTDHCRMSGHWCEKLGYAPYGRNMQAKYGSAEAWAQSATDRLKAWNFNLLGAGAGEETFYRGLAHTRFVAFGSTFSDISDLCPKTTWTGFPNVFHAKWEQYCDKLAREACASHKDDPWLFGYFLDNELEWYGKTGQPWGLFVETMKKPRDHAGKAALVDFLRDRYKRVERFSAAWQTRVRSFEEIGGLEELGITTPEARKVATEFVRMVADRYFAVTTAAIRKHDPNHMVLGCRFASDAPAGIWDIAGKYCDIVTFNYYGRVDLETGEAPGVAERFTEYYRQARRPLMITEWSFPALDSGLPCKHGAGQRFDTQTQRAQAYEIFQRMVFSLPFMVGSNYFMWVDEPALGISSTFPEDSNYGLVDENDEPYPELTETARRVNALVYDLHEAGMANVGVGEIQINGGGFSAVVWNRGRTPVEFDVLTVIDGVENRRSVRLSPEKQGTVGGTATWRPGGHLVVVEVDPDRKLSQLSRADDQVSKCFYVEGIQAPVDLPTGSSFFPVVVANPGPTAVHELPVALRLSEVGSFPWVGLDPERICVFRADGTVVPCQTDPTTGPVTFDSELSFFAAELRPRAAETFLVAVSRQPRQRHQAAFVTDADMTEGAFTLQSGALRLSRTPRSGNIIDEITLEGVPLGSYNPLIWQFPGQNQWVRANAGGPIEVSIGPVRARLRVTAEYQAQSGGTPITTVDASGRQEPRTFAPVPFRVVHEVVVYPERPWFHARLVSIENTGSRPLHLNAYFFYLNSFIGGTVEGDAPATPDVPNYYAGGDGAWRDQEAGWILGAEPWPESDLLVHFWVDQGGIQHPDARRQFETPIVLQPGDKYVERDAPFLTVYGSKAERAPWRQVRQVLQSWSNVIVETPRRKGRR